MDLRDRCANPSSLEDELKALMAAWLIEAKLYKSRGPFGKFIGKLTRSYAEELAFTIANHQASAKLRKAA